MITKIEDYRILNKCKILLAAIFMALSAATMPQKSLIISFLIIISAICLNRPKSIMALMIFTFPYFGMDIFNNFVLFNVPGLKISTGILIFSFFIAVLYGKSNIRPLDGALFISIAFILCIAVLRSISYMSVLYSKYYTVDFKLISYINDFLIFPLLLIGATYIVIKFVEGIDDVLWIMDLSIYSITILSGVILFIYIFMARDKADFMSVQQTISDILGQHCNDIANFYIIIFPLCVYKWLESSKIISLLILIFNGMAVGVLFSRTAYIIVFIGILALLMLCKHYKKLLVIVPVALSALLLYKPVTDRIFMYVGTGDINTISAGRTTDIWFYVINAIMGKIENLVFGIGRFAARYVANYVYTTMLDAGHSHNMYLDMVLEAGLIGIILFLALYMIVLRRIFIITKLYPEFRGYMYAIFVSVGSFLVSGFSGRCLFPDLPNIFIWIILGLVLGLYGVVMKDKEIANGVQNCSYREN